MAWDGWKRLVGALRRDGDLLDRPDLKRATLDAILGLVRRGARDDVRLPLSVEVQITVASGAIGVVRGFVSDPAFARELEDELRNRLPTLSGALPLLRFAVHEGERDQVSARELALEAAGWLRVEDGDRAGQLTALGPRRAEHFLGRGGGDRALPNDVVLTDALPFVSRRAAVLRRSGVQWELEPLDQGEDLEVLTASGPVRPRNTLSGRLAVQPGEAIRFLGPGAQALTVRLVDGPPEEAS